MNKLPKLFEQELLNKTRLNKEDLHALKARGVDSEYIRKLEKAWRTGKKGKDDDSAA